MAGGLTSPHGRGLSAFVLPTIRAVLLTSVVLANAGLVHANPAKVHNQVIVELGKPVINQTNVPEVRHAEQQARAALKQATDAQKTTEPALKNCAPIYADTALEWAKFRNELAQLASLQSQVRAAQKRVIEATAALKREQAYLEETEARRGRALATLEQLKTSNASPPSSSNTAIAPTPAAPKGVQPGTKERP